jgi:hypothetical protein
VELQGLRRAKLLGGDEDGKVWCLRKCDAGYTSPCGFGSPYVSRRCAKNMSILARVSQGVVCIILNHCHVG